MLKGYPDELNTLILVALLKEHNIKKVIISPGTTNMSFAICIQCDSWFEAYSAVDERSASFMACGLADASGEPVVLSCTGATASRNYLPGLTEAYYRKLPILAVTSSQSGLRSESYTPQFVDRTIQFADLVKHSFQASAYISNEKALYTTQINRAILEMTHNECGPVHINLEYAPSGRNVEKLPSVRKISRHSLGEDLPSIPMEHKVGILVGAHVPFSENEEAVVDLFCSLYNGIVICDQTSNYRGEYRFLANLSNQQEKILSTKEFDLLIYIGSVSGAYIPISAKQLWRVNEDGEIRDPFENLTHVFQMPEIDFFTHYNNIRKNEKSKSLLNLANSERCELLRKIEKLPFSNLWIAQQLSKDIPENSTLHFSILNSLRSWNFFDTPRGVTCFSNTGGFGIDGCMSSLIGAATANRNKQFYGIVGDLSFFYDVNVLANNLPDNIHIMVVNNGVGTEFKNYTHPASSLGEDADTFIAAKGHNGMQSQTVISDIAKCCDLKYFSAKTKEEFLLIKDEWIYHGRSLMEVFTTDVDESTALKVMNCLESDKRLSIKKRIRKTMVFRLMRRVLKRG